MKQLLSELDPGFETELLIAGRASRPSAKSKHRALRASLLTLAAATGAAAAAGAAATNGAASAASGAGALSSAPLAAGRLGLKAWFTWKAFGLGVLVGGAISAGAVHAVVHQPDRRDAGAVVAIARTTVPSDLARPESSRAAVPPPPEAARQTDGLEKAAAVPRPQAGPPAAAPITTVSPADGKKAPEETPGAESRGAFQAKAPSISAEELAAEVAALDRVRSAIDRGDFAAGLRALDDFERERPRARLASEALLLRIEALLRAGKRTEAARLARRALEAVPNAPYRNKLERLLSSLEKDNGADLP